MRRPPLPALRLELSAFFRKMFQLSANGSRRLMAIQTRRFSPRWRDTSSGKRTKKVRLGVRIEGQTLKSGARVGCVGLWRWAGLLLFYFSFSPLGHLHI